MFGVEAGLDREHALEACQEQSGADQQHEGKRHLRRDQDAPHDARAGARGAGTPFFAERLAQIELTKTQDGNERNQEGEDERQPDRERDNGRVDADGGALWRPFETEPGERADAGIADDEPERAAGAGEQQRFGQQLPRDAPEPGPQRVAGRELFHSSRRSQQHQVRDVDRAHEQDEDDPAPEKEQRAAQFTHELRLERNDGGVEARVDQDLLQRRKPVEVPRVQGVDLLARLLDGASRLQPREVLPVVAVPAVV
jgi:hypothetical protein